jgi:uroporphyrinogen III methyltransferase/synthase
MRHSSTSFTVITGHEDPDKGGEIDWETVARLGGTIVILMGVGRLAKIVSRLLAGGLHPDTPAAAVRWGSRPEQHTVRATLEHAGRSAPRGAQTIVIGRSPRSTSLVRVAAVLRPAGRRDPGREQASVLVRRLQRSAPSDRGARHRRNDPADGAPRWRPRDGWPTTGSS